MGLAPHPHKLFLRPGTPVPVTLQLTKNLACEWAGSSIRVNTVAPWYTATDLALQVLKVRAFGCGLTHPAPRQM